MAVSCRLAPDTVVMFSPTQRFLDAGILRTFRRPQDKRLHPMSPVCVPVAGGGLIFNFEISAWLHDATAGRPIGPRCQDDRAATILLPSQISGGIYDRPALSGRRHSTGRNSRCAIPQSLFADRGAGQNGNGPGGPLSTGRDRGSIAAETVRDTAIGHATAGSLM